MKLIEIEIQNVRGIKDLTIRTDGKNLVIWGANGSGKSGVVDAIDFLFTGQITRLTGSGTSGITLSKHGPHIDQKAEHAKVRAILQLPGCEKPIEISRAFEDPGTLHCTEEARALLTSVLSFAERGQYVLTRRDILKYITSEPSNRAKQLQSILDLTHIEEIRKTLVKVRNDLKNDERVAKQGLDAVKGAINSTIQAATQFKAEKILQFINDNRVILGGSLLDNIGYINVREGLVPREPYTKGTAVSINQFAKDLNNLKQPLDDSITDTEIRLRHLIAEINNSLGLRKELGRLDLTNSGIDLIDESGSCPLCDYPWPEGELRSKLLARIEAAGIAKNYQQEILQLSSSLSIIANKFITSIRTIINVIVKEESLSGTLPVLQDWLTVLNAFVSAVSDPLNKYAEFQAIASIGEIFDSRLFLEVADLMTDVIAAKYPSISKEQAAWDALTRLQENLKAFELAETTYTDSVNAHARAQIFCGCFESSRDNVLGALYDDIRDRLVELYSALHSEDENKFQATIEPNGAGLLLEVDFHGRGLHPPHALHSEGHQDSMGLCLYMALSEKLTSGIIDLIILDDVVMSVDAGHRKALCKVLATKFPNRQFLITTHDKTWCTQLRTEGIVSSRGVIEFYNWQVETGPLVNYEVDIWDRIDEALIKENVPTAAQLLRRGSEFFFAINCDHLKAPVTFKLSGQWELGDYLPAAYGQYKAILKEAKAG